MHDREGGMTCCCDNALGSSMQHDHAAVKAERFSISRAHPDVIAAATYDGSRNAWHAIRTSHTSAVGAQAAMHCTLMR